MFFFLLSIKYLFFSALYPTSTPDTFIEMLFLTFLFPILFPSAITSFAKTESIIPVCPPACGQARYGAAASLIPQTSTLGLGLITLFLLYRLYNQDQR